MKLNYLQQGQNRNFSKVSITNFPMRILINSMESRIGYSITFTQKYKVESTTVERSNTKVLCYSIDGTIPWNPHFTLFVHSPHEYLLQLCSKEHISAL